MRSPRRMAGTMVHRPAGVSHGLHIEPVRLLAAWLPAWLPLRSCSAHAAVIMASRKCSGMGMPCAVVTASVCMCMPTAYRRRNIHGHVRRRSARRTPHTHGHPCTHHVRLSWQLNRQIVLNEASSNALRRVCSTSVRSIPPRAYRSVQAAALDQVV